MISLCVGASCPTSFDNSMVKLDVVAVEGLVFNLFSEGSLVHNVVERCAEVDSS